MKSETNRPFDDFFAGIGPVRKLGPLERWIQEDPKRAERLWAVFDEAERRGVSMGAVIKRWTETEGPLPVQRCQLHRKWRDRQNGQ